MEHRARWWLARGAALLVILVLGMAVGGTLTAVAAQCPGSLAANSGFEEGFSTRGAGEVEVANGWQPWYQDGPGVQEGYYKRPEWKPENATLYGTRRVHSGNWAQKWFTVYGTHNAGVYQQISVPAGSMVIASAWFQTWTSGSDDITRSEGNYRTYIGIDPTGGTSAFASTVVWSPANMVTDQWVQQSVQAQAQGGTITVFLRGEPEFRNKHNDAYVDDVCVQVVTPPTATPRPTDTPGPTRTPAPTSAPTPTYTPEPTATPEATATVTPAPLVRIVVSAFEDVDGDGHRGATEAPLEDVLIELLDGSGREIASQRSTREPYTFGQLPPGDYTLVITVPEGYRATGPERIAVTLIAGAMREVSFGLQRAPLATETPSPAVAQPSATALATASATETSAVKQPTPGVSPTPGPAGSGNFFQQYGGLMLAAVGLGIGIAAARQLFGKRS